MSRRSAEVQEQPFGLRLIAYPGFGRVIAVSVPHHPGFIDDLKHIVPTEHRVWLKAQKLWLVQVSHLETVEQLLMHWFRAAPMTDRIAPWFLAPTPGTPDWAGTVRRRRQTRKAPPRPKAKAPPQPKAEAPPPMPQTHNGDPFKVLGLLPTVDPDVAKAAYRILAGKHHPDAGGSNDRMARLNNAWDQIRGTLGGRS
jgi:hypothetical protein